MSKANLLARLQELGVHPSKLLGQNFLLDPNLAQAIVASIEPTKGDHIVEIGPGMGALTQYLIESPASRITLLERDHRLVEELKHRYENHRVQVVSGDAVKKDLRQLYGWGPLKVIGNLPYSVATAIIAHFTEVLSPACRLVFMLQREVAERLVARPGNSDYAALTVLLGRRWSVKKLRVVPPEVFWPRPHVESAIVEIVPRKISELLPCDEREFKKVVKLGFSSRRKKLGSLLKKEYPQALEVLKKLGHATDVRAEELELEEWSLLASQLSSQRSSSLHELADVVDATDAVVDVLERKIIHVNKLRHRAVHVLIFNEKGELFLQKRSFWKENHPGLWCSSAAGHVMAGECYAAAAQREVREELGISVELTPFARLEASPLTGEEFIECFYGFSEGPLTMEPYELETGAFFPVSVIERWLEKYLEDFTPVLRLIVKQFSLRGIAKARQKNPS